MLQEGNEPDRYRGNTKEPGRSEFWQRISKLDGLLPKQRLPRKHQQLCDIALIRQRSKVYFTSVKRFLVSIRLMFEQEYHGYEILFGTQVRKIFHFMIQAKTL